jgi:TatD DNase family protein
VGVHPHDAKTWTPLTAQRLAELLQEPKAVALGEIGLDYHYNYSSREEQLRAFQEQMSLAAQSGKPVIVHSREAHQDTYDLLNQAKLGPAGGVMHCYTGSLEMGKQYLRMGLHISFAGALTFTNASKLREVAAGLPLDRILVETDSPYLTPHPFRGQRNEPGYVRLVGEKLAELKGLPVETVMKQTADNTNRLFGL